MLTEAEQAKAMRKIQLLIDKASHANTGQAERDIYLDKANDLMLKYAIDEARLAQARPSEKAQTPVAHDVVLCSFYSPWKEHLKAIMEALCEASRCKLYWNRNSVVTEDDTRNQMVKVVGWPADVSYTEMLYLMIHMQFIAKMDPGWDPKRTEDENIKLLKEAGMRWENIARLGGFDWPDGGKLIRAYRRQCKREGVPADMQTQRHQAFRNSFANSFANTLVYRLQAMWRRNEESLQSEAPGTDDNKGALVLMRGRQEQVMEVYYQYAPEERPESPEERAARRTKYAEVEARQRAAEAARRASMTQAQRDREDRKRQREEEKDNERYWRDRERYERSSAKYAAARRDDHGLRAGQAAANSVDLTGGRNGLRTASKGELQ